MQPLFFCFCFFRGRRGGGELSPLFKKSWSILVSEPDPLPVITPVRLSIETGKGSGSRDYVNLLGQGGTSVLPETRTHKYKNVGFFFS